MNRKPILLAIVDDEAIYRKLLIRKLLQHGMMVMLEAEHGYDLLLQLYSGDILPHIIIMDIEMPVMDGYQTVNRLKAKWKGIKVIAHSSLTDDENIEKIINCGADSFVAKPDKTDKLLQAIMALTSK